MFLRTWKYGPGCGFGQRQCVVYHARGTPQEFLHVAEVLACGGCRLPLMPVRTQEVSYVPQAVLEMNRHVLRGVTEHKVVSLGNQFSATGH